MSCLTNPPSSIAFQTMRLHHVAPLYPPEAWNPCDATIQEEARTNNWCEGWNNLFRLMVGHDTLHPVRHQVPPILYQAPLNSH